MIISDKNKYLFLEVPQTGSVALSHELCTHYAGEKILEKHSFYSDFLKMATPEQKKYFVFAGVRNPLDEAITNYYKVKTNYGQEFTDPVKWKKVRIVRKLLMMRMFEDVHNKDMDFQTYFTKYYNWPYNNFACLIPDRCDFLIRFERLQEDFARLLQCLGLEQVRPLPVRNPTKGRSKDFLSYYSPAMIPKAKRVFGPFMKKWGYEFPAEWGEAKTSPLYQLKFETYTFLKKVKWQYLKFL